MEEWIVLEDFPNYSVSNQGRVLNNKRESLLSIHQNQYGYTYVALNQNGYRVNKPLAKLVAETFLPIPENKTFTTPIHFDGNLSNCQATNIDWRPRWFAIKHTRQFRINITETSNSVLNLTTEEFFKNCWDAVFQYGLLYFDIIKSVTRHERVFPTNHEYRWGHR